MEASWWWVVGRKLVSSAPVGGRLWVAVGGTERGNRLVVERLEGEGEW